MLYLFAAGADVGQDLVDAQLVDDAQALIADPEPDPAAFTLDPEAAGMKVGHEPAARLVIRMGNIVPDLWAFTRYLTNL